MPSNAPSPTLPPRGLPEALLLLVAMIWGSSYGVAKQALDDYPILGFLALRFLLTAVLLAPAVLASGPHERREAVRLGLPIGGLLLLIFLCETWGVAHTHAANAAFLISLCVVLTPFAEWWMLGRRPTARVVGYVLVSLLGAGLLAGRPGAMLGMGDVAMLAAAALRAVIVCLISRWTRTARVSTLALTAVQSLVVGMSCLLAIGVLSHAGAAGMPPLPEAPTFWWSMIYLVLGCTVFAFLAQNWALRFTAPTHVALLTGTEPAFGALFAVLWLGEVLTLQAWMGGALIVAASLLAVTSPRRAQPRA